MGKISFKEFLKESEIEVREPSTILNDIKSILDSMSGDDLRSFGVYLLTEFTDMSIDEVKDLYFEVDDILDIIQDIGEDMYEFILNLISEEGINFDDNGYIEEPNEYTPVLDTTTGNIIEKK